MSSEKVLFWTVGSLFLVLPWSYIKWPFSLPMISFFLWPYELKKGCNKAGRFLVAAVFAKGGRKGCI